MLRISGIPCPKCRKLIEEHSRASAIARRRAGGYPNAPSTWGCEVCGVGLGTVVKLFETMHDAQAQHQLLEEHFPTLLPDQRWVMGECDGARVVRSSPRELVDVLGTDRNLKMINVLSHTLTDALELLTAAEVSFETVPVDEAGFITTRWHELPLSQAESRDEVNRRHYEYATAQAV